MRIRNTIGAVVILISLVIPEALYADAAYFGKVDMVKGAEAIALVAIEAVEPTSVKGAHWTYGEVADARVEKVLKGSLPDTVKLYGGEDFICAQCNYAVGRFLVFLRRDGALLTGSNWHLSIRPINGDTIEWYKNDESTELGSRPLSQVLEEVRTLVRGNTRSGEQMR